MQSKITTAAAVAAFIAPVFAQGIDGSAQGFSLVARILKQATDGTIDVEGYQVAGVHTGAGQSGLTLVSPSSGVNRSIFFSNGTRQESFDHTDSILESYPTSQYPSGIVIGQVESANTPREARIDLGSSTRGVSLYGVSETESPGSQPFLGYRPVGVAPGTTSTQFIVCNETVYGAGDVPLLFWEDPANGGETPSACAEIKLLPQCEGNVPNATEFTQTSYCYKDAASTTVIN